MHRLRYESADGVLLHSGGGGGCGSAEATLAAAEKVLEFHQTRVDCCAPLAARAELPAAAVAPLLHFAKAAGELGKFEAHPEPAAGQEESGGGGGGGGGRAAVEQAAAILRAFSCDVSNLEEWLRAPDEVGVAELTIAELFWGLDYPEDYL